MKIDALCVCAFFFFGLLWGGGGLTVHNSSVWGWTKTFLRGKTIETLLVDSRDKNPLDFI